MATSNLPEVPHTHAITNELYSALCNTEHKISQQTIGRLLTYVESLFEPGPRLEAVKSNIRQILHKISYDSMDEFRTIMSAFARATGDVDAEEWLRSLGTGQYMTFTSQVEAGVSEGSKEA